MGLIGYIVIGIVIVALLLVYGLFVLSYLGSSKGYKEASRVNATIIEDLGKLKMATGSVTIGVPRYRTFHKYKVSFWVNGKEYVKDAELRNCKLNVGDSAEVRYGISKNRELELKSEAFLCWTREMTIGISLGLILGIVLCILKGNGVI